MFWLLPRSIQAHGRVAFTSFGVALGASLLTSAQSSPPAAPAPPVTPPAVPIVGRSGMLTVDEETIQKLLRPRAAADVELELQVADRRLEAATVEYGQLREIASIAAARVDVKKAEIRTLKERIKIARREKDVTLKSELDQQLENEEAQLTIFEQVEETSDAHARWIDTLRDVVRDLKKAREHELTLASKRDARGLATTADAATLAKLDGEISSAARRYGAALKDYASSTESSAKALRRLVDTRVKLLDLWEKLKGSKGLL